MMGPMGESVVLKPAPPERMGEYSVVRALGAGTVEAVDGSGRRRVLKDLAGDCLLSGRLHSQIRDRLSAVRGLAHGSVANLYGVERDGERVFLVWDFVEGERLDDWAVGKRIHLSLATQGGGREIEETSSVPVSQSVGGKKPSPQPSPASTRGRGQEENTGGTGVPPLDAGVPSDRRVLLMARELVIAVEGMHALGIVHGRIHGGNALVCDGRVRLTHVSPLLYTDQREDTAAVLRLLGGIVEARGGADAGLAELIETAKREGCSLRHFGAGLARLVDPRGVKETADGKHELTPRGRSWAGALFGGVAGILLAWGVWQWTLASRGPAPVPPEAAEVEGR